MKSRFLTFPEKLDLTLSLGNYHLEHIGVFQLHLRVRRKNMWNIS